MTNFGMSLVGLLAFIGLTTFGPSSISQVTGMQPELITAEQSYNERWRVFKPGKGTIDVDPYTYVYSPEFATRFRMPAEWVSTDLKGADAIAFRVTPDYVSCGWGGDPKACRTNAVRCEMDVYFDFQRNPLPWDGSHPEVAANWFQSSSRFIPGRDREYRLPSRRGNNAFTRYSPFINPMTKEGLAWQDFYKGAAIAGWITLISYDKEIFSGTSLVTLGISCSSPPDELWLVSDHFYAKDIANNPKLSRRIELPSTWKIRAQQAEQESNNLSKEFYKKEGVKALNILRENAIP